MEASNCVTSHPAGAALTVWVVPGARRTEIVGFYGDALRVRVAAPPEKGRANRAVVELLQDRLNANLRLISGAGSRRKRLLVLGVAPEELSTRVAAIAN